MGWDVVGLKCQARHDRLSMLLPTVSAQAPNSAITAQTGVGVASTVHLNPMQLMTVDASHARHIQGIQPAPISAQGIQPAPIGAQGIQPAPIGTQGLHPAAPIGTQGLQPAPISAQQPQADTKTSGEWTEPITPVQCSASRGFFNSGLWHVVDLEQPQSSTPNTSLWMFSFTKYLVNAIH